MERSTHQPKLPPIISVVGKPKVGKTTFMVALIVELRQRGVRVGVIKHSVHTFALAEPGRDTWQHAQAGAEAVAFAGPGQLIVARSVEQEPAIDEIVPLLGSLDLVLTEGYKRGPKPKIEVSRRELGVDLVSPPQDLIAVVSDYVPAVAVPCFALDDAAAVAEFICQRFLS